MKKIIAAIMAVSAATVAAFAFAGCKPNTPPETPPENPPAEDSPFIISLYEGNSVAVLGYAGPALSGTLSIPSTIYFDDRDGNPDNNYKSVTAIGDLAFADNVLGRNVTTVEIPETVQIIGEYAFCGSKYINSIIFAGDSQLQEIHRYAFANIPNLKTLKLPKNLDCIEEFALFNSGITSFDTSVNSAFIWENDLLINANVLDKSDKIAVYVNPEAESITFPDDVKMLATSLFYGNKNIKTVNFNKVTTIGPEAFVNSSVENLVNSENIKSVSMSDFANTPWLKNQLSSDTVSLGKIWLRCTKSDGQIIVPEGIEKIGADCFANDSITSIILPETLKSVGQRAFAGCTNLEWVYFKSDRPPILDGDCFTAATVIYVKNSSLNSYKNELSFRFLENSILAKDD